MEQLRVWREMDERGEELVVIYHSHTATEAYPSRTDIAYASEPGAHYVLVSTHDPDEVEFRSFRIVDGVVTEEEVRVAEDDPAGDPVRAVPEPEGSGAAAGWTARNLTHPPGSHLHAIWSATDGHRGT